MIDPRHRSRRSRIAILALMAGLGAILAATHAQSDAVEIRGQVTGRTGAPVAGATVRVLPEGSSERARATRPGSWKAPTVATTDDEGAFAAVDLAGAEFAVRVEAPGRAPTTVRDIPAGAWLSLSLTAGHELRGRVVEADETAVAEAVVLACDADGIDFGREACRSASTDEQGAFVVDGLPAGEVELRAHAAGFAVSRVAMLALPAPTEASETRLVLRRGARVTGRVVDERDEPVADVRVYARPLAVEAGRAATGDRRAWPIHTDEAGAFAIDGLPAGTRFGLFAYREDRGMAAGASLTLQPGQDVDGLEITLPASAAVTLQLLDENDLPVNDLEIYYRESADVPGDFLGPVEPERVERGAEGRLTARIARSGTFDLRVAPAGCEDIEIDRVLLEPGGSTDLGTLVAISGLAVRGRVSDTEGQPMAFATVEAKWSEGNRERSKRVLAEETGRYVLTALPEIALRVEASASGFVTAALDDVTVPADDVDLVLQPTGGLTGEVELEEGGVPEAFMILVHVEVEAEKSAGATPSERYADFPRKESFTTEDGTYLIEDMPPGRFTVEARAIGRAPGRRTGVDVEHGELTEVPTIALREGLTLEGRVVVGEDDSPVAGANVQARREGGSLVAQVAAQKHSAGSDEQGRFRLEGLEPGPHVVTAAHTEFAPASERVEVLDTDEPEEVVLRLSRGGTLRGTVRDAEGEPAAGRRVVATRDLGNRDDLDAGVTDTDGRYELQRLAPGAYVVSLIPAPGAAFRMKVKNAVVREGDVTILDFDESSPITLTGTLYRDGQALPRVQLFFAKTISLTDFKFTNTDSAGRYEVGLDAPGRYRVLVQSGTTGGSGGASTEIEVPDLESPRLDIHLGNDGVEGRVTDADDRPVAGAVVSVAGTGGGATSAAGFLVAETGRDGRYTIQGLNPGVYTLSATAPGFRIGVVHGVELEEGGGVVAVDIRLDSGDTLRGRLVDEFGGGIPGAAVLVGPAGSGDTWGTAAATAMTDVNGAFRLTLPVDGQLDVTALPGGRAPVLLLGVLPPEGEELVLHASRGGALRIVVVDAEGAPQQGVPAFARPSPPYLGSDMAALLSPLAPTDATGVTEMHHLATGTYLIGISGRDDVVPRPVSVGEDAETLVQIELP